MWVSRIRVTGGFLSGLDVSLSEGLNVVIGPRGAGKTTFLELLRHAVGARHAEEGGSRQRQAFLNAVLGAGEVIVDVESADGGRHLVVDASGGGQRADLSQSVMVLGQNELEEIASDAHSRLNLLDLRTGTQSVLPSTEEAVALTGEIFSIRAELDERREESRKRERLVADRELLSAQETALIGGNTAQLAEQREFLRQAEEKVIETGQDLVKIESVRNEISNLLGAQERLADRLTIVAEHARSLVSEGELLTGLTDAGALSQRSIEVLTVVNANLSLARSRTQAENIAAREAAAPIREELERAESGLGQITAQLRNIDASLRALDDNDHLIEELHERCRTLIARRSESLDEVEHAEEQLYQQRAEVARFTTSQIANNVVVVVDHLADSGTFYEFLQNSLRGSNTRIALINSVAERTLPRQLLEIIENDDPAILSAVVGIPEERAQRLIENLNKPEILQGMASIRLSDSVDFRLRDGSVDKSVDQLSTGQKCAVTLPIVLSEQERTLILDQPEDHLDNAFLVKNVVEGLVNRRESGAQTIVATHNANIPVLGAADNVIVLTSDGRTGSVEVSGEFDSNKVVEKITQLMEGGREAFARRSVFYATHGEA